MKFTEKLDFVMAWLWLSFIFRQAGVLLQLFLSSSPSSHSFCPRPLYPQKQQLSTPVTRLPLLLWGPPPFALGPKSPFAAIRMTYWWTQVHHQISPLLVCTTRYVGLVLTDTLIFAIIIKNKNKSWDGKNSYKGFNWENWWNFRIWTMD